jgi:hypothetical protein
MDMTSLDWMHLLLAAPNIRELRLARCSSPAGGFQTLNVADLPFLEKAEFRYIPMTVLGLKAFFAAAPRLRKMTFKNDSETYTPFERCEFQEELYSSMREIAIYFDGSQKGAIDSFLPFIERMPNLQSIYLTQCSVSKKEVDEGVLQAYTYLKSFKLLQSAVTGSYLGSLFNAATSLKSLFWNDSVCDSPLEYLNEQALCQLSTLDFRNVKLEPSILDAFLQRTPHLQHLILLKVILLITEKNPSLMLAPGSLSELVEFTREWDTFTALSADDCLSIIKAAPHLQKLVLPYYFLKHFSDLPDGFLSELKVFYGNKNTCSKPGQEKKYRKLLRIAPNVATKG